MKRIKMDRNMTKLKLW